MKFIQSPSGFIVPSYSFGITNIDGVVYCSNPGRHLVESYSPEGEYISSFGKPGGAAGLFSGCCNPVYLLSHLKRGFLESVVTERMASSIVYYWMKKHWEVAMPLMR